MHAIDQQHEALFVALNRLAMAPEAEHPAEVRSEVLSKLGHQIQHHFAAEERIMAGLAIPSAMFDEHCLAHLRILEEFAQVHLDSMAGEPVPLNVIIHSVAKWISQHLIEFDLDIKPYLPAKLATVN